MVLNLLYLKFALSIIGTKFHDLFGFILERNVYTHYDIYKFKELIYFKDFAVCPFSASYAFVWDELNDFEILWKDKVAYSSH